MLKVQGVEIEIEPWKLENALTWIKVMAQDLGSDLTEELLRLDVIRSVGIEMARDYISPYRFDDLPTILLDEELPVRSAGSNSWVVSGAHTESGMPILANDPHLVGDTWRDMEARVERIEVSKADEPVFVTVRSTRNGPS